MIEIQEGCEHYFESVKKSAESMGEQALESLNGRLEYLATYANREGCRFEKEGTKCVLSKDFAPFSFSFSMFHGDGKGGWTYWFSGGLIYSGPGVPSDGSFPSLTVSLSGKKDNIWSVHT